MTTHADVELGIAEVAERVGVNPKTIRYYEQVGVLPEPSRTATGYRRCAADDVERLAFVRRAQRFGFTLDEIRQVLTYRENDEQPCAFVLDAVRRHAQEVARRITELRCLQDELAEVIARAAAPPQVDAEYCNLLDPA